MGFEKPDRSIAIENLISRLLFGFSHAVPDSRAPWHAVQCVSWFLCFKWHWFQYFCVWRRALISLVLVPTSDRSLFVLRGYTLLCLLNSSTVIVFLPFPTVLFGDSLELYLTLLTM